MAETRAVTLPAGFKMTGEHLKYAQQKGIGEATAEFEFERFMAHHEAKGSKFKSWNAAWRTWVLNHIRFSQQNQEEEVVWR